MKDASDILLDKFTVRYIKHVDVDAALAWLNAAQAQTLEVAE